MVRSLFFALTATAVLLAATSRSVAQVIVHRPNPNKGFIPSHSSYHSFNVTRFSAQPIYPTRFHASPIYPRTTFWSTDYPNVAVGPAYSLSDLGNLAGPVNYPGTDIPLGRPDFDAMLR
jgi:hypothetical protein